MEEVSLGRHTLTVKIPSRPECSYLVQVGSGFLHTVVPELRSERSFGRLFVVTDSNVAEAGHLAALVGNTGLGTFVIKPPGEAAKRLRTVESILSHLERERYGRDTTLIALGGGVVGDVAGFAAAIFKRGVPCVQVPTTTLSLADSAIGGKVGVDSELSKNAFGAFWHPARVYMDCDTVRTLNERHYRAGLVESVKHAMIADAAYFGYLEANLDRLLARDADALVHITRLNVGIKGDVVFRDPEEANLRRVLNFGHTIGHAVEAASGYTLHHGEAVAIGIVGACLVAERLGLCSQEVRLRASALFQRLGVPTAIPEGISEAQLLDTMSRDKKARGGTPRFVLLEAIGRPHCPAGQYAVEVPGDALRSALKELH